MRLRNKDIAKQLGISVTSVSLALNGRPGVSQETRRRVLELVGSSARRSIHELDDVGASRGAVVFSVHKKHGEVMNDKPFFARLAESAQVMAQSLGYTVTLAHYVAPQDVGQYMNFIRSMNPVGVLVEATEIEAGDLALYQKLDVPLVLIDSSFDLVPVDAVELDNQVSVLRALEYVYKMGHREIGWLQGVPSINNFAHRLDGFMKSVREFRLEAFNHPVVPLRCQVETAYADMKAFLANPPEGFVMPTCFLADLDYIAIGAMNALEEAGYRIPQDISMVGYDDVPLSGVADPPLTTTRVNRGDAGEVAMRILDDRIRNNPDYHLTVQISSEFVVRESVRALEAGSARQASGNQVEQFNGVA